MSPAQPHPPASVRELRSFGLLVGGILAAIGGWWLFRGRFPVAAPVLLGVGALLFLLGAAVPKALAVPHRGWMTLAEGLGWVMTRVILSVVFYLVVTPIGVVRRLTGADPLRRRSAPADSYWHPYPARHLDPKHYEKLY